MKNVESRSALFFLPTSANCPYSLSKALKLTTKKANKKKPASTEQPRNSYQNIRNYNYIDKRGRTRKIKLNSEN